MMSASPYTVRMTEDKAAVRLDRALASALPGLSRNRVRALIEDGRVTADGGEPARDPARRVRPGEVYHVHVPAAPVPELAAQAMTLDVVHEDAHLIVVNKPPGLVVHPGAGNPDGTLVNALLAHCGGVLAPAGGPKRPGIVHRLDKDTSGLLIAAKSDLAYHGLVAQFAAHSIERAYHALVWGVPTAASGSIEGNVGRDPRNRKRMAVVARGGKPAATDYRVLERFGTIAALLECRPRTGRTHQIRVHLSHLGHPIVGDPVYGGGGNRRMRVLPEPARAALTQVRRQALHAFLIGVIHPATGQMIRLRVQLFNDIKCVIESLHCN